MNKTTKTISYIIIISLLSKLFGFINNMMIAAYYGASWQTDAFNMAFNIIGLSTSILSMGVATVVIPMYNHRLVQKSKSEADSFASNILCVTSLIYGALAVLGMIFAPALTKLLAPDFNVETAALSTQLLRMMFIFTIATNAVNFLCSISRSNGRFLMPTLVGFPLAISLILCISLFARRISIYAMVIGYIVAYMIQLFMIAMSLRKSFKFKAMLNFTNGDARAIAALSVPIFVSIGVDQLNTVIDRMLASGLMEGSITAIGYAQKLRELPNGIIAASIITVILPMFSQYAAKQDFANVKALANKTMSILFAVMTPITLVCVYYSKEIVQVVYQRGAFTQDETVLTANIFIYTIIALFFMGGNQVLNNAFYGMQDTKTPRLGAVIAVGSNIVLNLILVKYMQAAGLALATSISSMLNYAILLIFFRRKRGAFGGGAFVKNSAKCTIATAAMLPVFLLCEVFRGKLPTFVFFCVCALFGLIVYAVLAYIMKIDIIMFGIDKAKKVLKISKKKIIDDDGKKMSSINSENEPPMTTDDVENLEAESDGNAVDGIETYNLIDAATDEPIETYLPVMTQQNMLQSYIITPTVTRTAKSKRSYPSMIKWYHIVIVGLVAVNAVFLLFGPVKLGNIFSSSSGQTNNTTGNQVAWNDTSESENGYAETTETTEVSETNESETESGITAETTDVSDSETSAIYIEIPPTTAEDSENYAQSTTQPYIEPTTQPVTIVPTTRAPVTQAPTTRAPVPTTTRAPVTQPPATTTRAPVTQPPPTTTITPTTTAVPTTTEAPTPAPTTTVEVTVEITTADMPMSTLDIATEPDTTTEQITTEPTTEETTTEAVTTHQQRFPR